ncbi:MAG: potassium channel family protein [Candidatus Aenigmatarchaeota archaeon]
MDGRKDMGKLLWGLTFVAIIFVGGALAYSRVEGYTFVESLYYVVLSVTTVGAFTAGPNTVEGLWLTMILVLTGMGVFLYVASQLAKIILEGRIRNVLGKIRGEFAKMRKEKDHIIICGYTKLGKYVAETLENNNQEYVIIEEDTDKLKGTESKVPALQGNPMDEEILKKANIKEAEGLVAALDQDADNIYVLMSARDLNPDLILAGKASDEKAVKRLHKVGAQVVVRPEVVGGRQLATSLLKMEEAGELETLSTEEE